MAAHPMDVIGVISSVALVPLAGLMYRWSKLLDKVAQTVYGVNGNNGLNAVVRANEVRLDDIEKLGIRTDERMQRHDERLRAVEKSAA